MAPNTKKYCIIGTGGFGRETLACIVDSMVDESYKIEENVVFMVEDSYFSEKSVMGVPVIRWSEFIPEKYNVVVAIADPIVRKRIVNNLPTKTTYISIYHPSAIISQWVNISEGCIIMAGVALTCNIKIGKHSHLNLHTTIGHDSVLGDFFTAAPSVNISGNCRIGECVYVGTNSAIRDTIDVCSNAIVGMGAVVVADIKSAGKYVGNPAKKIK